MNSIDDPLDDFTTDDLGNPIMNGGKLHRKRAYVAEPQRQRVSNRLDREELAHRVNKWVLGDLETMLRGIDSRRDGDAEGNFLLLAGCLMALEYFATIYAGEAMSARKRVKQFSARFLSARYVDCWDVLWPAARNGILHGFWPSRVRTKEGEEFRFSVGCETNMPHLTLTWQKGLHEGEEAFCVNARQMLLDLMSGVTRENGFQSWIRADADDDAIERGQPSVVADIGRKAVQSWRNQ